eukprot:jgi/Bigna1/134798/aug1.26_g9506
METFNTFLENVLFHFGASDAQPILEKMEELGFHPDRRTYEALIEYYSKASDFVSLWEVFLTSVESKITLAESAYLTVARGALEAGDGDDKVSTILDAMKALGIPRGVEIYREAISLYAAQKNGRALESVLDDLLDQWILVKGGPDIFVSNQSVNDSHKEPIQPLASTLLEALGVNGRYVAAQKVIKELEDCPEARNDLFTFALMSAFRHP